MEQAGTGGSSFEAETADSSAGGSVRPDRPLRDLPSQSDTPDQPDLPDSPELPDVPDELPPEKVAPLPDVVLSTLIHWKGSHSSVVVAPLEAERGPFELADSPVSITFSPGGSRFAYVHYLQLFVVDSWPPKPRALDTGDLALEPVWLDESRLLVTTNRTLELLDVTTGERETLFVNDPETSETGYPSPYLVRPSPDGRWVVFGRDGGSQQALLLNLEPPRGEPVFLLSAENGFDSGSFDWAPDSEHLALSVRHSWGLLGYTISTKDSVGDLLPFTIPLDETSNVTTFEWSPSGDALHYHYHRQFYQGEDPVTLTDEARLYLVDTSEDAPKPSELLSSFAEPSWPSPGTWSPKSDRVAFSIESVGTPTPQSALYTSDANAPTQPVTQHSGEFESVSQPAWASDGGTL